MKKQPPGIVAFYGHSQVGKTTAARIALQVFGGHRFSFSKLLKEIAADLWRLSDEQLNGTQKELTVPGLGATPRHLLQALGAAVRKINATTWIDHTLDREVQSWIASQDRAGRTRRPAWIDDLRHTNEADAVRLRGGVVILIEPEHIPWKWRMEARLCRLLAKVGLTDFWRPESVRQVDLIQPDAVVRNNGVLRDFESRLLQQLLSLGVSYTPVTITPPDEEQWETVLTERVPPGS